MNDDSCDSSFGDDHFNTDKTFERRYTNKKKIKEYLQKWKGYSCMNDVSKLEDLEYDSIVLDYNVQKKNKDATSSKLQKSQLGASGSSYVKRSTYTIPCHYLADKAKPIHRKTKEIKQPVYPKKTVDKKNVSDTSNEGDNEFKIVYAPPVTLDITIFHLVSISPVKNVKVARCKKVWFFIFMIIADNS
uniref:Bm10120, isoform a n=1 Tax=Brugia malayi TaxID=6279 RepID=A0A1I9G6W8_BRUMA|nr:Bm10120, isoform a [Brugia malayi]